MSNKMIMVIGGYGNVGSVVSESLGALFPGKVIVAGRNFKKAQKFSKEQKGNVIPLKMDASLILENDPRLSNVKIVVMCIEQLNDKFVRQCFDRGINYIDITAQYSFITMVESLKTIAQVQESTCVLSVGLAPGMSNLLARYALSKNRDVKSINIFIYLSLGDKHGKAAIQWALNDLNDQFCIMQHGVKKRVSSYKDPKSTWFGQSIGQRKTYRANFSDQHVIARSLNIDRVSTRICFDSVFITWLCAALKKIGVSKLFKFTLVKNSIAFLLSYIRFGKREFVIKVEAENSSGEAHNYSIQGVGEAYHTGIVAAKVAEELYARPFPHGVFHIDQLFDPIEFIESLDSLTLNTSENKIEMT